MGKSTKDIILEVLANNEKKNVYLCHGEILKQVGAKHDISSSTISRQIGMLRRGGFIYKLNEHTGYFGTKIYYKINKGNKK
jgi:hypothetical protein